MTIPQSDLDLWSDEAHPGPYPLYRELRDTAAAKLTRYGMVALARYAGRRPGRVTRGAPGAAGVPEWFDLYIGLEAAATRISWYQSELVPGLFQTADYARELIRLHLPGKSNDEIDRSVELRLARQVILKRPTDPPLLKVALRESVLRCPAGAPGVMPAQLYRLAEASELPNVSLRVVPFAAGLNSGMLSGPFEVLRFPVNSQGEDSEPPTVFSDLFTGSIYLDKPHEVERYDRAFGETWETALDDEESRDLLRQAAEVLR